MHDSETARPQSPLVSGQCFATVLMTFAAHKNHHTLASWTLSEGPARAHPGPRRVQWTFAGSIQCPPPPPGPCVTFPTSLAASTLRISRSWERLCVKHAGAVREVRQGGEAALVGRGTPVSISPSEYPFPQWLGISNVNNSFLSTQTSACTRNAPGTANWHAYPAFLAPQALSEAQIRPLCAREHANGRGWAVAWTSLPAFITPPSPCLPHALAPRGMYLHTMPHRGRCLRQSH